MQNRRLENLLAESILDPSALKDLLGKTPGLWSATLRAMKLMATMASSSVVPAG
jgi:hypothetical protein